MAIGTPTSIGSATFNAAAASAAMTVTANVSVGDFIIVAFGVGNTGKTIAVTDSAGNSWATDISGNTVWSAGLASCVVTNALTSGVSTITASWTGNATGRMIAAVKVSGLAASSFFDKGASATGTVVGWSSGNTATLAQADTLLIGTCTNDSNSAETNTPGTGYTETHDLTNGGAFQLCMEYQIVAATTAAAGSGTWTNSGARTWRATVGAYEGAASAATKAPPFDGGRRVARNALLRMTPVYA